MSHFKVVDLVIEVLIIAFDNLNLSANRAIKHVKLLVEIKQTFFKQNHKIYGNTLEMFWLSLGFCELFFTFSLGNWMAFGQGISANNISDVLVLMF